MKYIYLIRHKIRSTRRNKFVRDIYILFKQICLIGFPKIMEQNIMNFMRVCSKLRIKHIWIFFEKNFSFFLNIHKVPEGPLFSFEILMFSLKRELTKVKRVNDVKTERVLIFNNFFHKGGKIFLLEILIKDMFSNNGSKNLNFKNRTNILFVDLNDNQQTVEFRCYNLVRENILMPRALRKTDNKTNDRLKQINEGLKRKSSTVVKDKFKSFLNQKEKFSSIKIRENGPRFTLKFIEITNFSN